VRRRSADELQQIRVIPGLGAIPVANTGGTAKEEEKTSPPHAASYRYFWRSKLEVDFQTKREDWEADIL
jgi:hypothetical protein